MAKVPVGKVLLRNVIRHTDAHNKARHQPLASISLSPSLFSLHLGSNNADTCYNRRESTKKKKNQYFLLCLGIILRNLYFT